MDKAESDKVAELRKQAEERLQKRSVEPGKLSPEDMERLIHELEVHQIELEMQNDELRRVQQKLQESRDKYSDLYDFAPVGYLTVDENVLIIEANLTVASLLGVERSRLIGKPLSHFIAKDDQDVYYLHRKQVLETRIQKACELRMMKEDGAEFYAELESIAIDDSEGDFSRSRTVLIDITERKRSEEILHDSLEESQRRRYEMALRGIDVGFWDWDIEDGSIYFSENWKYMLGCVEREISNNPDEWFGRVHPENISQLRKDIDTYLESPISTYESEHRILHEDRTYRWMLCRGFAMRDAQGKPHRMVGIHKDITETKRIEEEQRKSRTEMEEEIQKIMAMSREMIYALNSVHDAIAIFDLEGRMVFHNRRYREVFGLNEELLNGISVKNVWDLIKNCFLRPDSVQRSTDLLLKDPDDDFEQIVELRLPETGVFHHSIKVIHNDEGVISGFLTIYRDISELLEFQNIRSEVLELRYRLEKESYFGNIIGISKGMREVYEHILQSAQSGITVLIEGESGTGKELVARAIHFNSDRARSKFVVVNCAAIPETLIESELFGHERGAFTGAISRKIGKFEQADGGTILLDEIGEMSNSTQAVLLRVLQEREIQRVGGIDSIPVDVRVIASTNRDLEAAMKRGDFRDDLFYRISAFRIAIPNLKERREDIPLLLEHFLNNAEEKTGKSFNGLSSEAMDILINYDWPGNIRELENAVHRAALVESSDVISSSSIPLSMRSQQSHFREQIFQDGHTESAPVPTLAEVEKRLLEHALKVTDSNISEAARALDIGRATVYRKLVKYSLLDKARGNT